MIDQLNQLITDQTILAILPIVTMGIITGILGLYFARKERRESEGQEAQRRP